MSDKRAEAEANFAYWTEAYATDLLRGRDPNEFGMRWMAHQIAEWRDEAERQKDAANVR